MMQRAFILIAPVLLFFGSGALGSVLAQEEHPARIELGVQFSSLNFSSVPNAGLALSGVNTTEAGFGGRFTLNLNKHFALEAEGNFFPHQISLDLVNGTVLQGQAGVKAGQRFKHFGLFAKARPGIVSFSEVLEVINTGGNLTVVEKRKQFFSLDVGGVVEFYPSRRILTRFDVGDTMIRNLPINNSSFFNSGTVRTTHHLQISSAVGFRFLNPSSDSEASPESTKGRQRYEVGAQFTSLGLRTHDGFSIAGEPLNLFIDTRAQIGFGGRFTYNLNRSLGIEAESDFFPRELPHLNRARAAGRVLQCQLGLKAGKRFSRFGVFGKARPGIVSFSKVPHLDSLSSGPSGAIIDFHVARRTYFSTDLGGVLEFYPSARIVTRFDAGDTLIHYGSTQLPVTFSGLGILNISPETIHNFQFSAGVGFRF